MTALLPLLLAAELLQSPNRAIEEGNSRYKAGKADEALATAQLQRQQAEQELVKLKAEIEARRKAEEAQREQAAAAAKRDRSPWSSSPCSGTSINKNRSARPARSPRSRGASPARNRIPGKRARARPTASSDASIPTQA